MQVLLRLALGVENINYLHPCLSYRLLLLFVIHYGRM